ncbi:MAG: hypothetical protein AAFX76_02100 [Planctomycetota bacterium]
MPEEIHPQDAALLTATRDDATGVEYIPTGRSPYFLEYRRSLYRTLRAAERANDLRVYADGDLTFGVRPGRCYIGDAPVVFDGQSGVPLVPSATTSLWLDSSGAVQASTSGLPDDRGSFIPLAEITTLAQTIGTITDLRGEAFLQAPGPALLGLTATAEEINRALEGAASTVTDVALNQLTAGPFAAADSLHSHASFKQDVPGEAVFRVVNNSFDPSADLSVRFSIPELSLTDTVVSLGPAHRFLQQTRGDITHSFVGSIHLQTSAPGTLGGDRVDIPVGAVPIDGQVTAVVLSLAGNLQSSDSADGVTAVVRVNGAALTDTPARLTSADGPGFVCTDRGDGVAAILTDTGAEDVRRGDVVTLDLTRRALGTISAQARHATVLVVVRPDRPE